MNINIDEVAAQVDRLLPWELTLTIAGKSHPTRRPTLGMICELEARGGGTNAKNLETVRRIFDGHPPDLAKLTGSQITAVVAAYLLAFNEAVSKNSNALVAEIKTRIDRVRPAAGASDAAVPDRLGPPGTSS